MPAADIDNTILNSRFDEPDQHSFLVENGVPTGIVTAGRRGSEFVDEVPPSKHKVKAQTSLALDNDYGAHKPNDHINTFRDRLARPGRRRSRPHCHPRYSSLAAPLARQRAYQASVLLPDHFSIVVMPIDTRRGAKRKRSWK